MLRCRCDIMTSSMETQEAIRRQALEMQDSIKELQKFAEQARKKDAALKAAAARRPKAPVISSADGKVQPSTILQIANTTSKHHPGCNSQEGVGKAVVTVL